jgi:hypothetical protein
MNVRSKIDMMKVTRLTREGRLEEAMAVEGSAERRRELQLAHAFATTSGVRLFQLRECPRASGCW